MCSGTERTKPAAGNRSMTARREQNADRSLGARAYPALRAGRRVVLELPAHVTVLEGDGVATPDPELLRRAAVTSQVVTGVSATQNEER